MLLVTGQILQRLETLLHDQKGHRSDRQKDESKLVSGPSQ